MRLMATVRISEAKRNFSKLFARARKGETIILQNGDEYAMLVPCSSPAPIPDYPIGTFRHTDDEVRLINEAPADLGPLQDEK